jgi:SNF2 family DNA or RNA helicase
VFSVGHRVLHRSTGRIGFVLGLVPRAGDVSYSVGIDGDKWSISANDLEAAVDGFESLSVGTSEAYPYETWLKREAMALRNAYRNDPAGALSNSRIEPQAHQISVLISCVEKVQARMILADEVGLGKTIEAGLVLKELRARGNLARVLILVPAGLVSQWIYELRSKFNEVFVPHNGGTVKYLRDTHPDANPWSIEPNVIASLALARGDQHREELAAADWDLVIVDEAHHARNWWNNGEARPNQAYELLELLHDRVDGLLLLTATPMQLHEFELFSMISLVEPGLFRDFQDFSSHLTEVAEINRVVGWLRVPKASQSVGTPNVDELLRRLRAPPEVRSKGLDAALDRSRIAEWLTAQHRVSQAMLRNRKAYVGGS